jgi:hypothetical protein
LLKKPVPDGFVTGHDFSRADKANQINWALAPAGCLARRLHSIAAFFNEFLSAQLNQLHKIAHILKFADLRSGELDLECPFDCQDQTYMGQAIPSVNVLR